MKKMVMLVEFECEDANKANEWSMQFYKWIQSTPHRLRFGNITWIDMGERTSDDRWGWSLNPETFAVCLKQPCPAPAAAANKNKRDRAEQDYNVRVLNSVSHPANHDQDPDGQG